MTKLFYLIFTCVLITLAVTVSAQSSKKKPFILSFDKGQCTLQIPVSDKGDAAASEKAFADAMKKKIDTFGECERRGANNCPNCKQKCPKDPAFRKNLENVQKRCCGQVGGKYK
ncbi:MAG: hypothetical protein LBU87_05010 [Lactobacillales bacterium]|jgi:hypothetical protein|nr:hypothetical protein [Lactobacillales bacterium]